MYSGQCFFPDYLFVFIVLYTFWFSRYWQDKPETRMILRKYLRPLKEQHIDTLILGCTHYPFLLKDISRNMGAGVTVIDPRPVEAESLKDYLHRHPEIETLLSKKGARRFLTTESPKRMEKMAHEFLAMPNIQAEKVSLNHN